MTDKDRELLISIDQMIADAPKLGVCSISFRILKEEVERLMKERDNAVSAVEDLTWQFAYKCIRGGRACLTAGSWPALGGAFNLLGLKDPHPVPECECQQRGCHRHARCSMPTQDGYKRLCSEHAARCLEQEQSDR